MNINKSDYKKYADKKAIKSPLLLNVLKAFVTGGLICSIGQGLTELYSSMGYERDISGTLCSITLIFISFILTSLGIYDKIAKFAGAGTLVPITGFANAVVSSAIEFKDEGMIIGVGANIFKIAGAVITYGIVLSVLSGIYHFICRCM